MEGNKGYNKTKRKRVVSPIVNIIKDKNIDNMSNEEINISKVDNYSLKTKEKEIQKNKSLFKITIVIVFILLLMLGVYFGYNYLNSNKFKDSEEKLQEKEPSAEEIKEDTEEIIEFSDQYYRLNSGKIYFPKGYKETLVGNDIMMINDDTLVGITELNYKSAKDIYLLKDKFIKAYEESSGLKIKDFSYKKLNGLNFVYYETITNDFEAICLIFDGKENTALNFLLINYKTKEKVDSSVIYEMTEIIHNYNKIK